MKKITTLLAALTVLTICSCGQSENYPALSKLPESVDLASVSVGVSPYHSHAAVGESSSQTSERESDRLETAERKIVKKGSIKFETPDVNETKSLITQTVLELNGYISDDNVVGYSSRIEHRVTIRVPADEFDSLLYTISESVSKLDDKKIEVLDVTEEYIDIEARTKTKKELQNRYVALLDRAETVEDILRIEKEIGNLQSEIESVEGRMRFLRDRIAFSTLNVTYYQEIDTPASPFGFSSKFAEGIKNGWYGFLWFIIGLSHLWVFLLLIVVVIYFVRLWRKNRKVS